MGRYVVAQSKIMALMQRSVDADGEIRGLSLREIERRTKVPWSSASVAIKFLIEAGRLMRTADGRGRGKARYRLGGEPKGAPVSVPSEIESVVRMIPHNGGYSTNLGFVAVSLPRLRCLETVGVGE